ncbi:MAG: FecR domain-containing protein [Candidatus Riflebacteria bacterium]|nr:FecR domain-containing protein [Candidatus Riflebacteria bacterium]
MTSRSFPTLFLAFVLALAGAPAGAADALSASELIKVEGKVEVKKGQAPAFKPVPSNLKLAGALKRLDGGDKVRTAVQSAAELMLKDTCVLAVKEGSLFEVPLVLGEKGVAQLKAQQGHFLFKVVSGSDFKVQTADVVAAVKGTLFEVEMTDSFQRLLQTPGVEIGIDNAGGTMVDVIEGEVELTNQTSKGTRRLKAGEGISVFNRVLMGLDKGFASGFGDVRRFQPLERIRQSFGQIGEALHGLASTRQGLLGFQGGGLSMPLQRLNLGGQMGRIFGNRVSEWAQRLGGNLQDLNQAGKALRSWGKKLVGDAFKPEIDERRFPVQKYPMIIPEVAVKEAHLGEGLFVAAGPRPGCQVLKLTPEEGQGLVLQEGEGTFHLRDFIDGIDGLVTVRQEADQVVTVIEMKEGTLSARVPGETEVYTVAAGQRAGFVTSTADGATRPVQPAPGLEPSPSVMGYVFRAQEEIKRQREQHEAKVRKGQAEAAGQAVEAAKNGTLGEKVKNVVPKIRLPKKLNGWLR